MKEELSYYETIKAIDETKKYFERQLEVRLGITKAQSGVEKQISFKKGEEEFEIIHSLTKWKREALR